MWTWHKWFERHTLILLIGILVVVSIGGLVQIAPLFFIESTIEEVEGVRPYTPLELTGRQVYIREGCYVCHSQMVRPLRDEVERYGHYSLAAESMYDHPFQWGSKRTGPDLAREGGARPNSWHYEHMMDPRSMSPQSNMPPYAHLKDKPFDQNALPKKIAVMRQLGVPYPAMDATSIKMKALEQGAAIAEDLKKANIVVRPDSEMVAIIAYLQKLGQYDTPAVEEVLTKKSGGGVPFPLTPVNPDKARSAAVAP